MKADTSKVVEDPTEGFSVEQKIHWMIVHRKKEGIEPLIDVAIAAHGATPNDGAVWTLNNVLLPAMKEVGDKFGAGELILPFVLQSAEVMKKAVAHLEKSLDRKEGTTKGKVVLATVYGDVHDIGKSLVNTILSNNGYTVFDLGKQVPANVIIDKAVEVDATAIGLSALLVSTSKQMPLIVNELQRRGLHYPGADRRRGDQSALWAAHPLHRIRRALRVRRVLLQRRVRGSRHDGEADRSGGARRFDRAHHCRGGRRSW